MIDPNSLSRDQKRFLKERYDLDFDEQRPYLLRDRVLNLIAPWPNVILVLGLLLERPSAGAAFPSQPFEIITCAWAALVLFVCWALLIITLAESRRTPSTDEQGKEVWSWLFRDRIGWRPRRFLNRWDVTGTSIGVGLMALLTDRIGLAGMWAAALLSLFAVERLFDDIVRAELAKMNNGRLGSTK
jgi:hypothetical protein